MCSPGLINMEIYGVAEHKYILSGWSNGGGGGGGGVGGNGELHNLIFKFSRS